MIQVFAVWTEDLPDPALKPSCMDGLAQYRRDKIDGHRTIEGRRQSLGAGLLLKYVLEQYGIGQDRIRISENGKPEADGICFNLSHSGSLVICAVGTQRLGCDAERIDPSRLNVAAHFFSENENLYLQQFEGMQQAQSFCRIWTMRESYIKMTGEGMRLGFSKYEILLQDEAAAVLRNGQKEKCHFFEYEAEGFRISVCSEETQADPQLIWVKW